MDSLKIDNHSKRLVFKQFKRLLYRYCPKFVKTFKKYPYKFDMRQLFVLLYDCVLNMKNYYSIDRILKNNIVLQEGTVKNPTTPLYSDTKKKKKIKKKNENNKKRKCFKMF